MEINMGIDAKEILMRLNNLQSDVSFVKEHIEDIILTEDDIMSIEEARRELKEHKTVSHEKLKKDLGL